MTMTQARQTQLDVNVVVDYSQLLVRTIHHFGTRSRSLTG
jgi:hypothetical protein